MFITSLRSSSPLFSPSPSVVSSLLLSLSLSPFFCCGLFFLCFVLSLLLLLPLVAALLPLVAAAGCSFRSSFSPFPLVFSVTQAIAE